MNGLPALAKINVVIFIFIFLFMSILLSGQEAQTPKKGAFPAASNYEVSKCLSKVKINGKLDEEDWQRAVKIPLPYEWMPGDNIPAPVETECMIMYSHSKLYIGFRCFDPHPGKIRAHLMDRDAMSTFIKDDHVSVMIDTFNDERRAFLFQVNPLGVQADAVFSELEGEEDFSWDGIWDSAGRISDSGYTVEIAIPFNQLRFPRGKEKQTWGISIARSYPRNVRHQLISHIRDRNIACVLCQVNKITGFEKISPGRNLEFDPTFTLDRTDKREDFPDGVMETGKIKVEPGITGRWGITPNMMLNATANPDFSQVEADVAQLEVNRRFAIYYPEKRPFFLEGADFFRTPIEAVFTRTVFDPLWGLKLTGKQGRNAFGFFVIQDRYNNLLLPSNQQSISTSLEKDVFGSVLRYRRDVGKGSTLGFLYTGRIGDDYYNHAAGLDGFIRFSKTKSITFQYLRSQSRYPGEISRDYGPQADEEDFGGNAFSFNFKHASRHFNYGVNYEDLSPDFRADFGFTPRVDYRKVFVYVEPVLWGKRGEWFDRLSLAVRFERINDHDSTLTDQYLQFDLMYDGPLQSIVNPSFFIQKEFYNGVTYDKKAFAFYVETVPVKGLYLYMLSGVGDYVDYMNSRLSWRFLLRSGMDLAFGQHLNINLAHTLERLSLEGDKIYTANLLQTQWVYNFNVRTFIRATIQYTDINRNVDLYTFPIDPESRTLFTQFLFSYKINPQTVLFIGYSDNHMGWRGIDITQKDRTFFLKIGYALVL